MLPSFVFTALGFLTLAISGRALDFDINDPQSITAAAQSIVSNIIGTYNQALDRTGIPGLFPDDYYWWESGLAFDSLINYWAVTGDDTHNDLISEAMVFQVGPDANYMPPNQSKVLGNDDQSTWALACMTAAERGFPDPPAGSGFLWVELAQRVFDTQVTRWTDSPPSCGGGLRWQVYPFNSGYDYKNSISNGNFMQLAARLYHYTDNQTYSEWAEKASDWSFESGLISNNTFAVYDGMSAESCQLNRVQWTATLGTYLSAYAYMANSSDSQAWATTGSDFAGSIDGLFTTDDNIMYEVACAPRGNCITDQEPFRAILSRAVANWLNLVPDTSLRDYLSPMLQASAQGAGASCSGGDDNTVCGTDWEAGNFDNKQGLGQDLSALEVLLANIPAQRVGTAEIAAPDAGSSNSGSGSLSDPSEGSSLESSSDNDAASASTSGAGSQSASAFAMLAAVAFAVAYCF